MPSWRGERGVYWLDHGVCVMPRRRLQHCPEYRSSSRRFPRKLRDLPQCQCVAGRRIRPQRANVISPDRSACGSRLQHLPCEQPVRGDAADLRGVSPDELYRHNKSEPRRGRISPGLRAVSRNAGLEAGILRSFADALSADRIARVRIVLGVSRAGFVCGRKHIVRFLPSQPVQQDNGAEPRCSRLPAGLPGLSQYDAVARSYLRPQSHAIRIDRHAHAGTVRKLSRCRALCRDTSGLLFVPYQRIQYRNESQPRCCRFPKDV